MCALSLSDGRKLSQAHELATRFIDKRQRIRQRSLAEQGSVLGKFLAPSSESLSSLRACLVEHVLREAHPCAELRYVQTKLPANR